ncbi:MAG TPA: 16S rRNA (adenine(1518)-N(6)/adenine(1519)-N(6))-dimethyltransferase RsmA [Paenalcaligenes sp.]|nr:16S rRNA (adenine(1518)-N(6)/adenine(1519)-N(6))-dimethyltransferase RsmA [Paenalcaligenes sp.]
MHTTPRKRFGQHFLHDLGIVDQIVRAIDPQPQDRIIEIGPGLSALTRPLLWRVPQITAIEIDRDLVAQLRQHPDLKSLEIIQADVLEVDFKQFGDNLRIVGNLPYNISSPLLFHLLQYVDQVQDQHFMLQKEMVERMSAQPGTRHYSRLSVMLQAKYRMMPLFDVPPEAFDPPPNVMSAVVRMRPLSAKRRLEPKSEAVFAQVVARAFSQRRKMLRRVLSDWQQWIDWQAFDAQDSFRAEQLSVTQFVALSDQLTPYLEPADVSAQSDSEG